MCILYVRLKHLLAACAKRRGPQSTSLAATRKPWEKGTFAGALTRYWRLWLRLFAQLSPYVRTATRAVTFIKAGERPQTPSQAPTDLLSMDTDWQLSVELGWQLKFLAHIVTMSLRPDIVLLSESARQVIMLQLTVPWEDRIEEAYERKRAKYQALVEACTEWGGRHTVCLLR